MRSALVCLLITSSSIVTVGVAIVRSVTAGAEAPADSELFRRLKRGRDKLKGGHTRDGVQALRGLLSNHPDSPVAMPARDSLARAGFGLRSRVVLRESKPILARLDGRDISHFVRRVEEIHSRLGLFFRQTYSETHGQEFRLVVLDSPARFKMEFPQARRRSAYKSLDTGWTNFPRAQVAVFWDAEIASANPQNALDVLFENAAREMARTLVLRYTARRRLPESFDVGLSEYLALRLFPKKLVGVDRTLERIARGLAREALGRLRLDRFDGFQAFLRGGSPELKLGRRVYVGWVAASYSLVDFLVHGDMPPESDPRAAAIPPEEPRNAALQELLRGYERKEPEKGTKAPTRADDAATFLGLVEGQFHLDDSSFHEAWVRYVLRYPRREVDFDLFSEL